MITKSNSVGDPYLNGFRKKLSCLVFLLLGFMYINQAQTLQIDSVSVLPDTNHIIIGWGLSDYSGDGYFEVSRRTTGETYNVIHSTADLTSFSYVDNSQEVENANSPHSYFVIALDIDGNTINTTPVTQAHQTIYLEPVVDYDYCYNNVVISWQNYFVIQATGMFPPMPTPFDRVSVQISRNGGSFVTESTFPLEPIPVEEQSATIANLEPGNHRFRIQAFHSSEVTFTSTSNIRAISFDPPQITNLEIDNVDVVDNNHVLVNWEATGDTGDFNYVLFRSDNALEGFEPVDTTNSVIPSFTDYPDISTGPWFYRIMGYLKQNDCDIPAVETVGNHSSIFLDANVVLSESRVYANWTHATPNFWNYQLQELQNGTWQNITITPTGPQEGFFEIDLGEVAGILSLRLEATEGSNTIHSNHAFVSIEPEVYIPNAFRPSSHQAINQVFKPIIPGYVPQSYSLVVFDRWGLKLFESSNKNDGWDGTINGTPVEPGGYPYLLRFSDLDGNTIERRGIVVLVQ